MKREQMCTVTICDGCGKNMGYGYCSPPKNSCLVCLKDFCFDCRYTRVQTFDAGVFHSGSEDGAICNDCMRPQVRPTWPAAVHELYNAYIDAQSLRQRAKEEDLDFRRQQERVDDRVKRWFAAVKEARAA